MLVNNKNKAPTNSTCKDKNVIIVSDDIIQRLRLFFIVGESYSEVLDRILDAVDVESLIMPKPDDDLEE